MSIFVTGFGAFGGVEDNPSAVLARKVAAVLRAPFRVLKVSYAAADAFFDSGDADGFDRLLMIGYADRALMTPELVGKNLNGETPGVDGVARPGPIVVGGPERLLSTLWTAVTPLPAKMRFSEDAGGYLCNYMLYRALELGRWPQVGFLHVPSFQVVSQVDQVHAALQLLS